MDIRKARSQAETDDAARLMRGLYEANKALYHDDLQTIEEYYRGAWFFADVPSIPAEFRPPRGDVLVAYLDGIPAGTVAIQGMDRAHCELKSMFVPAVFRGQGIARALCRTVIGLAGSQGYRVVRLTTGARQGPARHLYEALGFRIVTPWDADPPAGYDYFERPIS